MTTYEMIRCKKCSFCVIDDKTGEYKCAECEKNVNDIKDDDCPCESDY